jgi:Ca2+-dependent lipid-binding protein
LQTWDSPDFLSQSVELPGAEFEHRQILASTKFHDILVEYLTDSVAVYVIEATGLKSMDSGGTSDPFCEVWMESRATARKTATQVTKTMIKDVNPVYLLCQSDSSAIK